MIFFPYDNYKITVSLTEIDILNRFKKYVEPKQTFRFGKETNTLYEGAINSHYFRINRIYASHPKPDIIGQLTQEDDTTIVLITFKLRFFDYIVMLIYLITLTIFGMSFALIQALNHRLDVAIISIIVILILVVFPYVITMGKFLYERSKSKKFFNNLLDVVMPE